MDWRSFFKYIIAAISLVLDGRMEYFFKIYGKELIWILYDGIHQAGNCNFIKHLSFVTFQLWSKHSNFQVYMSNVAHMSL
jgi:hypothetical protein